MLYPQWWGAAQGNLEDDLVDEGQTTQGNKFFWAPYNTTSDNKALDACLLASRPGQTIRIVDTHSLVRSFVRPGRTIEGHTGFITRPPRQDLAQLSPNASARQIVKTLNLLKAAFQRHLRSDPKDILENVLLVPPGANPDEFRAHRPVGITQIDDVPHTVPMAQGANLEQARILANGLIDVFLHHASNDAQHRRLPPPDESRIDAQIQSLQIPPINGGALRAALIGLTNRLMIFFASHFALHEVHHEELEAHFARLGPPLADWPTPLGFTPQDNDRTLTTEDFIAPEPGDDLYPPIHFRGLHFGVDPTSQGPFNGFKLEHSAWIFLGAQKNSRARVTAFVGGCRFEGSPGDGILVNRHVNATVRKCSAIDCFRAGLALTGGNTSLTLTEFWTLGTRALRSGIDMEVEQYDSRNVFRQHLPPGTLPPGPIPRPCVMPSHRVALDAAFDFSMANVYLSRNLQLTLASNLDTCSRPSTLVAEGLVHEEAPFVLEGTHTSMHFKGCKLTNQELLGESSAFAGGTALGTLFWKEDAPAQPIVFDACILATRRADFVVGQGARPSDPNTIDKPIHEYAAVAINPGPSTNLDVTIRHCILRPERLDLMQAKADRDERSTTQRFRFFKTNGALEALFATSGLPVPNHLVMGVLVLQTHPIDIDTVSERHRIRVEGCLVGPGLHVGIAGSGATAIELVRNRIEGRVGMLWAGGPRSGLNVRLELGHWVTDRFMLIDLTDPRPLRQLKIGRASCRERV